ncbi:MAG: hypothetical protein QOC75_2424 [Pseudonocardiales bacterium]|nr:hypothetical protein [Pseudonocardiales bacterium]
MSTTSQRLCTWTAPVFLVMLLGGLLVLANFVPLPAPNLSAQQLADIFTSNPNKIRLGLVVAMLGTALMGPFTAVITVQLKRIEGAHSPFAYAQLSLGVMIPVVIILPMTSLAAAAYRGDRPPAVIQALSDQAWLLFVGAFYAFVIQLVVTGLAILRDGSERPVFPRWLGYLNFWCAIGSLPAAGLYFVMDGPLAWNGILSWWLPVVAFSVWVLSMFVTLLGAISRQQDEGQNLDPAGLNSRDLDALAVRVADLLERRQATPAP